MPDDLIILKELIVRIAQIDRDAMDLSALLRTAPQVELPLYQDMLRELRRELSVCQQQMREVGIIC